MNPTAEHDGALARLRDEQQQIAELFLTWARHRRDPGHPVAETARLAALIFTLLRVHAALESEGLEPPLARLLGDDHPSVVRAAERRDAVAEAIERTEALPPGAPDFAQEMAVLSRLTRTWFEQDENDLFALARHTLPDLPALDRDLARRQEALLAVGRVR